MSNEWQATVSKFWRVKRNARGSRQRTRAGATGELIIIRDFKLASRSRSDSLIQCACCLLFYERSPAEWRLI